MKREVTVGGKTYAVEFDDPKLKTPFSVKLNDKPLDVVLESEPKTQEPFVLRIKRKEFTVELSRDSGQGSFTAKVNSIPFKVELRTAGKQAIAGLTSISAPVAQRSTRRVNDRGVVTAPMSGKIIKVKVKKGDMVKAGDVLCTLEAMKMENEVTAPKNGVIDEVMVQEGKTVNSDDVLVVIK